ncbi:hypothetical protein [uncultured Chitinophaga sp.]|jgi:hypothetical protein|uniref:hypothetical protein n=1 Tax=uncultured Chitinophaga sp. TaxID=339340 RepID=UPI002634A58C|nr:hypothetical protein [uncultured Chitinophaga sp.]
MAKYLFNNGKFKDLIIPAQFDSTKIFLSAEVTPENDMISIAGHSIIQCLKIEIADVIFTDHPLNHARKLYDRTLEVEVNASKIKTGEGEGNGSRVPVNCKLTIEAGDNLLEEFELNDKKSPSANSVFIFRIKFLQEQ